MQAIRIAGLVAAVALALHLCAQSQQSASPPAHGAIDTQMRNVDFHMEPQAIVHISVLEGALVPTKTDVIPAFDDAGSFDVRTDYAELSLSAGSLGEVLNRYSFAEPDAPLKDLKVSVEKGRLKIHGKIKGKLPSFEAVGTLEATPDGVLRMRADKVKALGVPAKGLMDLFGVEVVDLVNKRPGRGVRVEGDTLLFDPGLAFPAPHLRGKVTRAEVRGDRIVLIFGDAEKKRAAWASGNYMSFRGNKLRFGKLTMDDTDLTLIDSTPRDPFDFYLARYIDQLAAGYSKSLRNGGLHTYMVDFNKLPRAPVQTAKNKK
jgi:hypothetical protein